MFWKSKIIKKKDTCGSNVLPNRSTKQASWCLTLESRRDLVLSSIFDPSYLQSQFLKLAYQHMLGLNIIAHNHPRMEMSTFVCILVPNTLFLGVTLSIGVTAFTSKNMGS